jgi:hypothetical protein
MPPAHACGVICSALALAPCNSPLVQSAGDKIAEIVVDGDIERDLRVALAELGEAWLNQTGVRDVTGVDAQQAMRALGEISGLLHRIAECSRRM